MTWLNFQSVLLTLIGTGCVATKRGTVFDNVAASDTG